MISTGLAALAVATGLGVGGAVGWYLGTRQRDVGPMPAPVAPPLVRDGLTVMGIPDPRELWARTPDGWRRLASVDRVRWQPVIEEHGDDPDTFGFPPLVQWVKEVRRQALVQGLLEEWTDACVAASRVAWVTEIPTGDQLLDAWARQTLPTDDPEATFGRWLVAELGRAGKRGLSDRTVAERRGPLIRALHVAAGRLLRALDESLVVEVEPPSGVGPRDREQWLVDRSIAGRLGNDTGDSVNPLVVLRPMLRRRDQVLIEGEVA